MARKLSSASSFQSDDRSNPPSPNHFILASPNQSMPASPNNGLTILGNNSIIRNRVLIGKDATKEPSETCLVWALKNLIRPGDSVIVLGILHRVNTPMGYKSQANLSDFVGTNKVALEAEMSQKLVRFEDKLRALANLCDSRGVFLDITITAGTPLKSVLVKEALKMKVSHVLLDRHLRRDRKYYKEHLQCDVVAFSEKNQAERVRESSISYMFDNPGLPLPSFKSESSTVPSSPSSATTSFTYDGNSIPISNHKESKATTQSFMERSGVDTAFKCLPDVDLKPNRPEDLGGFSPEFEEQSNASSASHSRENSFIDLFMLSSPDGITPVWSSVNENKIGPSPERASSEGQAGLKAEIRLSPTKLTSSPVKDEGREQASTEPAPSSSYFSDQGPLEVSKKEVISVQPRRHFPQLSELIKAHEYQPGSEAYKEEAEDRLVDSHGLAALKGEETQLSENIVSDVVVDDVEEKHRSHKSTKQVEGTEDVNWGKQLAEAPPLCSVCKRRSMELGRSPRVYDWVELKAATNDFAAENLIAEGGFSFVYKGTLQEGQIVAIKKLKASSFQGDVQFTTEVEALSCAQHRNLVRLLGYGVGINERALVYEYVCNGSLDQHLSGRNCGILEWPSRYKIAIGAARGLRYLHEECRVGCIVHRDMRPNNILVTHDFVPMVGDFGLAKLNTNVDAAIETQVVGALGYLAPEYVESGQVTSKTDVYSFGVVLLELITGRKAIDLQRPKGEISLIEWARHKLNHHRIHELVDQNVAESLDMFELDRMVKAASLCIKRDPQIRPCISRVLQILEGDSYDFSMENTQEVSLVSSAKPANKSHSHEDFHQSRDNLQMLHNTSKRVSTVPRSWRNFIRT